MTEDNRKRFGVENSTIIMRLDLLGSLPSLVGDVKCFCTKGRSVFSSVRSNKEGENETTASA